MAITFQHPTSPALSAADVTIWRCNECGVEWHEGYTERVWGDGEPPKLVAVYRAKAIHPQHKPGYSQDE